MGDKIRLIIDNYKHEQSWKKKIVITLMISSLFVVTGVFWSLKLNGIAMAGEAFCGKEEHIHSDECYESVLICELEENEEHQHNEECYEKQLICTKEEHTHVQLCYSDVNADKEDKAIWESTLPSLSKDWSQDLVHVALSQKGYKESEQNFILADDQTRKGYTRYGAWYGHEYGDWNEMFVSFCLNYADIPNDAIPYSAGFQAWKVALADKDIYEKKELYEPQAGDIVFLNHERVGIVTEVNDLLHVIVGDLDNEVKEITYDLTDESIDGYIDVHHAKDLYSQRNIISLKADIYTDKTYKQFAEDQTVITVTGELPETAKVKAYPVFTTLDNYEVIASYDLSIFLEDGTLYEPQNQTLTVQFTLPEVKDEDLSVYYVPETNQPEELETKVKADEIIFETNHFSVYAIVRAIEPRVGNVIQVSNANEFVDAFNSGNDDIVQLTADITVSNITLNKKMTLDLNGHQLTALKTLFTIQSGGELKIIDSVENKETVTTVSDKNLYGNLATFENNNLTYYVTKTEVIDSDIGTTQETLEQHIVSIIGKGRIIAGSQPLVSITGGTVDLESGMLYGGSNRAFNMSGGTLNLKGGYIFGFKQTANGAAIYAQNNSNINMSGSVLAGNASTGPGNDNGCGGAIYVKGNTTLHITGGVMSGNKANGAGAGDNGGGHGGGAIYADNQTNITMTGGYLTNNYSASGKYFDGGGAIFLNGNSQFEMSSGYITGNQAQGGGGIKTVFQNNNHVKVTMTGGYVSGNVATAAEGGGISIDNGGVGTITGGYITNNQILKTNHWGGGGLFCADGTTLNLMNVLITENKAGGFGGGIAGCPTGKIYLYVNEGCAVYDNKDVVDKEVHFVNGGAKNGIDAERCNDFFQSRGHKDYFCALNSTVIGKMLGDCPAYWEGSADGTAVKIGPNDAQTATNVMGLESKPTDEGKEAAQEKAKVYINGNYSYTHGGGILCNGSLIVGHPENIEVPAQLGIKATKAFLDMNGNREEDLSSYNFQFELTDKEGHVISTVGCDENGIIDFDSISSIRFTQEGTYEYFIKEIIDDSQPSISYDTTQYHVIITVKKEVEKYIGDTTKTAFLITNARVEKKSESHSDWILVSDNKYVNGKENLALQLTNYDTFVNSIVNVSQITVVKKWANNKIGSDSVIVDLYQDQNQTPYETTILNAGNQWTYTWNNLPSGHSYYVKERGLDGYTTSYTTTNSSGKRKNCWVPASSLVPGQQYIIVNKAGSHALYISPNHENNAFDFSDKMAVSQYIGELKVGDTTYTKWFDADGIDLRCIFTAENYIRNGNNGIILKNNGTTADTWLLVQDADNNYFKSTSGAQWASVMSFENKLLKGQDGYGWNPNKLRTIIYDTNKFNTSTNSTNAVELYRLVSIKDLDSTTITITNTPKEEYELPETGGIGTHIVVFIGLLLMLTPIIYQFKSRKRLE